MKIFFLFCVACLIFCEVCNTRAEKLRQINTEKFFVNFDSVVSDVCVQNIGKNIFFSLIPNQLYASDKVSAFDITINYDTSLVRFTNVLALGTIFEQAQDWGQNSAKPGSIRVYSYNLSRYLRQVSVRQPIVTFAFVSKQLDTCLIKNAVSVEECLYTIDSLPLAVDMIIPTKSDGAIVFQKNQKNIVPFQQTLPCVFDTLRETKCQVQFSFPKKEVLDAQVHFSTSENFNIDSVWTNDNTVQCTFDKSQNQASISATTYFDTLDIQIRCLRKNVQKFSDTISMKTVLQNSCTCYIPETTATISVSAETISQITSVVEENNDFSHLKQINQIIEYIDILGKKIPDIDNFQGLCIKIIRCGEKIRIEKIIR